MLSMNWSAKIKEYKRQAAKESTRKAGHSTKDIKFLPTHNSPYLKINPLFSNLTNLNYRSRININIEYYFLGIFIFPQSSI